MRIGQLARLTGTAPSRIRFYERQGLIPLPMRHSNGYRSYDEAAVGILKFVDQAQRLGFSLTEIKAGRPGPTSSFPSTSVMVAALQQKDADLEALMTETAERRTAIKLLLEQLDCRD